MLNRFSPLNQPSVRCAIRLCGVLMIATTIGLLSAVQCWSQSVASLEFACQKSSVVVLAQAVDYQVHESRRYGAWHRIPVTVRLKASKWFKGNKVDEFIIQHDVIGKKPEISKIQQSQKIPELDRLIAKRQAPVWFLNRVRWPSDVKRQSKAQLALFDKNQEQQILTADYLNCFPSMENGLRPFSTKAEFFKALHKICQRDDRFLNRYVIWDPVRSDQKSFASARRKFVYVLGGKQLEQIAINFVEKPEQYLTDHQHRENLEFKKTLTVFTGIAILSQFRSKENIELLKNLLRDTRWWVRKDKTQGYIKEYCVRHCAYHVLRKWGVDVQQPEFIADTINKLADKEKKHLVPHHLSTVATMH